jgi:putative YphP/YqiW family bacilliredoxin
MIMALPPIYPPDAVVPFREELTAVGFEELKTPADVDAAVTSTKGTMLCVINSVCGCAAGSARPGVGMALQNKLIPDKLVTVFAGMEREAVDRVRQLHAGAAPPSSPSMVLFKDGRVAAMFPRSDIEGRSPQEIAGALVKAFNEHCSRKGPSMPPEEFAKLKHIKMCGSQIPRFQ